MATLGTTPKGARQAVSPRPPRMGARRRHTAPGAAGITSLSTVAS